MRPKLYHAGFRGKVSKRTLADANERRDWRIYADFAQILIRRARKLYAQDGFGVALDQTTYVLDSSTIDLCMSLFPWAHFRTRKSGVKLHTLLDLRGNVPCFLRITAAKTHDTASLYEILQILTVSLFEKTPVFEALTAPKPQNENTCPPNQLALFDL